MKTTKLTFPESFDQEFESVKTLLHSGFPTGRNDAFVIAYVKVEKQVRRLFTFLIYQMPAFGKKDTKDILCVIANNRKLYFDNFIVGLSTLYDKPFQVIVGKASYDKFINVNFHRIRDYRNKIMHGQPTGKHLTSKQLGQEITVMRDWCFLVAGQMQQEMGFDGFSRNSFRKGKPDLLSHLTTQLNDLAELETFIDTQMS